MKGNGESGGPVTRRLLWAVGVLVAGGLLMGGLVRALEARLVFFPYTGEDRTPDSLGIRYTPVVIETSDGERLTAWQLEPEGASADVVYFHGNGGNLSVWLPVLATLHAHALRVLAVDYRGYGLSSGSPSERGVYQDAEAVVRYVAGQREPARPLVYWGRSLGGPIAASATRVVMPDALILESTFPDAAAVVRTNPVMRVLSRFSSYRFDTAGMLEHFDRPVLVLHGTSDSIIPHALGRELFEQISAPKQFVSIPGADHNDLLDDSRRDYWNAVETFVRRIRE